VGLAVTEPKIADAAVSPVFRGISAQSLHRVHDPAIGLVLWHRPASLALHKSAQAQLKLPPFAEAAEGSPGSVARRVLHALPGAAGCLGADLARLAEVFAAVTGRATLRLRLEHVADDACRRYHVDAVGLRLLCTYAGLGTEWIDAAGQVQRMASMQVGLFKGSAHPDAAIRVWHRSPPVSHLPPARRSRLLLCIDEPGVF
jgi:Protein of unknown function (DUF1826)